ncbi:MAG: ABC transporter permease [Lachnospiraceae bacterium]|nr:ABC transporter permease [Lachnospiraceae bacterium]
MRTKNEKKSAETKSAWKELNHRIGDNNVKLLLIAVGMFLIMAALRPKLFLNPISLRTMGVQMAEMGLFSIAMMIVFISGGIDLSIIAIANLTSVLIGLLMQMPAVEAGSAGTIALMIVLSFIIAIVMGIILGGINGYLIARFSLQPMLVTLGTMNLYMGIAIVLTKGKALSGFPPMVTDFGNGTPLGIPVPFIILVVVVAAIAVILNHTKYGFDLKLFGTNALASRFSGIPNTVVTVKTYIISGVISAITGVEMMTRTNTARADFGNSYLFISILCAILGGTAPEGGEGSLLGLVLAFTILQILSSGFNMLSISSIMKDFIWGALLLGVMALNHVIAERRRKQI